MDTSVLRWRSDIDSSHITLWLFHNLKSIGRIAFHWLPSVLPAIGITADVKKSHSSVGPDRNSALTHPMAEGEVLAVVLKRVPFRNNHRKKKGNDSTGLGRFAERQTKSRLDFFIDPATNKKHPTRRVFHPNHASALAKNNEWAVVADLNRDLSRPFLGIDPGDHARQFALGISFGILSCD